MNIKSKSRRELLKGAAAVAGAAAGASVTGALAQTKVAVAGNAIPTYAENEAPMIATDDDLVAYGTRSHYVTSKRIPAVMNGYPRSSPDEFGLTFHIATPLQDSYGSIQASSLHYTATTKGSFIPDIDPSKHTLMINGLVDKPRVFTMADLKRFPSVSRFHFIECNSNSHSATDKNVQTSHGLTSNAEWTGVLLSTLFKEVGVKKEASWFVAEGAEEIKGASTIPMSKGMADCIIAYGMNGEPLRPQQGFPVRLIVPGFEGIFNTKWLRHIKAVDQYQLNMDDFGHLQRSTLGAAMIYQIGPKSVITFPSGGQKLPDHGWYEITGLAWSGQGSVKKVEVSTDNGKTWKVPELKGAAHPMAHVRFGTMFNWQGGEHIILSRTTDSIGQVQPGRDELAKALGMEVTPTWRPPGNNNTIMKWKINKDGNVTNGFA